MTYNEKLKAIFKKHGYNTQLNKLNEDEIMDIMKLKIDRQCERDDIDAGNS